MSKHHTLGPLDPPVSTQAWRFDSDHFAHVAKLESDRADLLAALLGVVLAFDSSHPDSEAFWESRADGLHITAADVRASVLAAARAAIAKAEA